MRPALAIALLLGTSLAIGCRPAPPWTSVSATVRRLPESGQLLIDVVLRGEGEEVLQSPSIVLHDAAEATIYVTDDTQPGFIARLLSDPPIFGYKYKVLAWERDDGLIELLLDVSRTRDTVKILSRRYEGIFADKETLTLMQDP